MKKTVIKIMTALILGIVTMQFLPLTALGAINLDAYINALKDKYRALQKADMLILFN